MGEPIGRIGHGKWRSDCSSFRCMAKAPSAGTMGQLTYRQSSRGSPAPVPYAHQAGGHREQLSEEGGALVVPAPGLVAKIDR